MTGIGYGKKVYGLKIKRRIKYYLLRLFRIKASPQQVAFSLTLGFIPSWIPTFGIGPILSVGITKVLRGNIIAAVIGGVIGTPIWPLLFFLNYKMGSLFFLKQINLDEVDDIEYVETLNETVGSIQSGSVLFLAGSVINIIVFSLIMYGGVYILLKKYRGHILQKLQKISC